MVIQKMLPIAIPFIALFVIQKHAATKYGGYGGKYGLFILMANSN